MGTDYDWRGILMIAIFYMTQAQADNLQGRMVQILFTLPVMIHYGILGTLLAYVTILLYDGTRGIVNNNVLKYVFYAFYPVHLIAICFYKVVVC
mgnify:FL=1